ncbi:YheC/YheD family protein [Paenibacillus hexagrammi]|uniref:YheC/YheD family protein n=1 Tax=Paenibacillus hexagrammi TaxID=2908839 RepID=A0ABY3SPR2_9BACL|nr:YheC/YheD family protein [Paenibacillus sp. YPD9-1]UJF35822.1 YheC/YheD family protein [Paenibacillus sp. YPD9-1]
MGHRIGILFDRDTFRGIPQGKTGNERLSLYNKAAKKLGLQSFYLTLDQIRGNQAKGYKRIGGKYRLVHGKVPRVIHNRALALSPASKRKMRLLAKSHTIFNRVNRFDKHDIHRMLIRKSQLRDYLPVSLSYSPRNLARAMRAYTSLYIKPTNSSVGEGIIQIKQCLDGRWHIHGKKENRSKEPYVKRSPMCIRRSDGNPITFSRRFRLLLIKEGPLI